MSGLDEVLELASQWPAENTEKVTGISAEVLKQLVSAYLSANGAALYSSTGVNMGGQGAMAFWIQEVINAVSGNLDRRGGTLVGRGVMDFPKFGKKNGVLMREDRSRIGNFGAVNDAFPGGILADEILTAAVAAVRPGLPIHHVDAGGDEGVGFLSDQPDDLIEHRVGVVGTRHLRQRRSRIATVRTRCGVSTSKGSSARATAPATTTWP